MVKVHSWNEYDTLKTMILGSVYDNDRIPNIYKDYEQECFVKIVEQTNRELQEFQNILEQNNITVLRPKQPKSYNGVDIPYHEPAINMRDFHMAYGEMFFMSYGPYAERRYYHLWLEDIVNRLILDDNLICSANEINFEESEENFHQIKKDTHRFFEIEGKYKKPTKDSHIKLLIENPESVYLIEHFDWLLAHNIKYESKNTFHTASILRHNKICFMSEFNGSKIGQKWITNWLKLQNIETIIMPYVGHLDGPINIINNNSIFACDKNFVEKLNIEHYFENIFIIDNDMEKLINLRKESARDLLNPSSWWNNWQRKYKTYEKSINVLVINPRLICLTFYDADLYTKLKNFGMDVIYIEWSNAKFWEGGLHCITCDVERRPE